MPLLGKLFGDRHPSPKAAGHRPRIVLHIGRPKTGSTSIQHFCTAAQQSLLRDGIEYANFGHLWDSDPDVPGYMTFDALAVHARAHPDRAHLVSNEIMSLWTADFTQAAAEALAGCDVTILVYLRAYSDWIRSDYAELTRKAMNRRDIDAFIAWRDPWISTLPNLSVWGACFGWRNMRIRSLDPRSLQGGDLLADFATAIGVAPPAPLARCNVAPHWTQLELVRELATRDSDQEWGGADPTAVKPLSALMADIATDVADTPYLSLAQEHALAERYNSDIARLRDLTGTELPAAPIQARPERPFIPSFDSIPAATLDSFFAAAASHTFADTHPDAARRAAMLFDTMNGRGDAPFERHHSLSQ